MNCGAASPLSILPHHCNITLLKWVEHIICVFCITEEKSKKKKKKAWPKIDLSCPIQFHRTAQK